MSIESSADAPKRNLPYYSLYPKEFDADERIRSMDDAELGMFMRLLNHAWINDGLPEDPEMVRRIFRYSAEEFSQKWSVVSACFPVSGDGRRRNRRQEEERSKAIVKINRIKSVHNSPKKKTSTVDEPKESVNDADNECDNERVSFSRAFDSDSEYVSDYSSEVLEEGGAGEETIPPGSTDFATARREAERGGRLKPKQREALETLCPLPISPEQTARMFQRCREWAKQHSRDALETWLGNPQRWIQGDWVPQIETTEPDAPKRSSWGHPNAALVAKECSGAELVVSQSPEEWLDACEDKQYAALCRLRIATGQEYSTDDFRDGFVLWGPFTSDQRMKTCRYAAWKWSNTPTEFIPRTMRAFFDKKPYEKNVGERKLPTPGKEQIPIQQGLSEFDQRVQRDRAERLANQKAAILAERAQRQAERERLNANG